MQVGLPLRIGEQRIVIGTQILGSPLFGKAWAEHPAECSAVDVTGLDTEADNPPGKLIHNDEYPVSLQPDRFAAE